MKFDVSTGVPQYVYPEDHPESSQWRIAKGEQVRLRIVGLRMEATEFVCKSHDFNLLVCHW
jgi:hypothetical protein